MGRDDDLRDKTERLASLGEIAAEVAHELRNALQIISANVYLARQDRAASEPHLAKIERQARLAHAIVDDLMALARGEPAHAEPVAFEAVLAAAREDLPAPGAEFVDRVEPNDLEVRAHLGLLSRLLRVLYENAILVGAAAGGRRAAGGGASARRAVVTTTARVGHGAAVVIEVADDGPGVPPELADRLFEPLVSARDGGTGLGLALARRIAAAHGGTIALASPAGRVPADAARGAIFRVELPGLHVARGSRE